MLVQNMINILKIEADELLDNNNDNEFITYINHSIDFLSFTLAGMGEQEMIRSTDIMNNQDVPNDFIDFIPHNGYPVYIQDMKFNTLSTKPIKRVKYIISKPHVTNVTDTIPFRDLYSSVLVMTAAYLIKKKTPMPTDDNEEDKSFIAELVNAIRVAKGGERINATTSNS